MNVHCREDWCEDSFQFLSGRRWVLKRWNCNKKLIKIVVLKCALFYFTSLKCLTKQSHLKVWRDYEKIGPFTPRLSTLVIFPCLKVNKQLHVLMKTVSWLKLTFNQDTVFILQKFGGREQSNRSNYCTHLIKIELRLVSVLPYYILCHRNGLPN